MTMMERLLDEITDTERIQPLTKVINHFEKSGFNWNDIYLSTTTPGRRTLEHSLAVTEPTFSFVMTKTGSSSEIFRDLQRPVESGEKIKFTAL